MTKWGRVKEKDKKWEIYIGRNVIVLGQLKKKFKKNCPY